MNAKLKWYNKKTPHNHTVYTSHCGRFTIKRKQGGLYQIFRKGAAAEAHHVRFSIGSAKACADKMNGWYDEAAA
jgi:hypothetical protein